MKGYMQYVQLPEKRALIINRAKNSIFSYQGWPSVCRDENGVLYAVSSSFRCGHVCPFGKTAMYISRDNGKTWSPPTVINDTYLDDRDAGILYLGSGRMLVTWFELHTGYYQKNLPSILSYCNEGSADVVREMISSYSKIPRKFQNGGSFIRISENYGVTWSEPIRVPVTAPHGPNVCRDGMLIYFGKDMDSYTTEREDSLNVIALYISEDGGYTWIKQGVCNKPDRTVWESFHEPHVIELPDGALFGMI
ncbi:MAG: sialidase family protein [Eubacteriales bacterium]